MPTNCADILPLGEDGSIRAWTAARGKLCGTRTFSAFSNPSELDEAAEESRKASLDDRIEGSAPATTTGGGGPTKRAGDVPVPVCALASYGAQPLIAVGLCHGTVHIVFVKQVFFWSLKRSCFGHIPVVFVKQVPVFFCATKEGALGLSRVSKSQEDTMLVGGMTY